MTMITDELRRYAHAFYPTANIKLLEIADRIDTEHEAQLNDAFETRNSDENLEADGWVRLPVDADGVPIRFGDKVTVPWSEKVYEVSDFSYTQQLASGERTIWVDVYSLEKMGNIPLCGANSCHHHHAPTTEDVLRELLREVIPDDYFIKGKDKAIDALDLTIADYAKRLQLKD